MRGFIVFLLSLLLNFSAVCRAERFKGVHNFSQESLWTNIKVEGKTLILDNGEKIKTPLYNLKYIGQLESKTRHPYFILSGRECDDCDANISIYIWCPDQGPMDNNELKKHYSYPGKERDLETNELIYVSRMYYGNCSSFGNSVIWIQKILNDNNKWVNNIFIVKIAGTVLQEITISKSDQMSKISSEVKNCKELTGTDYFSEP